MTAPKRVLPKITWDQADLMQLATSESLMALGFKDYQLREWSAEGRIHPVGTAPGGAHLFHAPTVFAAAKWVEWRHVADKDPTRLITP